MRQHGFTLVELLIIMAIIGVIGALAVPSLLRARMTANEASAISSLRAIQSAQVAFRVGCGRDSAFASTLPQLGAARTLSPDLTSAETVIKSGYAVTLQATTPGAENDLCADQPTALTWYAQAAPVSIQVTGSRGFATAQGQAIWQDRTGAVPAEPFAATESVSSID